MTIKCNIDATTPNQVFGSPILDKEDPQQLSTGLFNGQNYCKQIAILSKCVATTEEEFASTRNNPILLHVQLATERISLAMAKKIYLPLPILETNLNVPRLKLVIFLSRKTGPAPLNVAEYERYAADTLSRNAHGYYASGSNDMITLRENRDAYSRLRLMPKILVDVSTVSTGTSLFLLSNKILSEKQYADDVYSTFHLFIILYVSFLIVTCFTN